MGLNGFTLCSCKTNNLLSHTKEAEWYKYLIVTQITTLAKKHVAYTVVKVSGPERLPEDCLELWPWLDESGTQVRPRLPKARPRLQQEAGMRFNS